MKPYKYYVDQIPQPDHVTPVVKYYAYKNGMIYPAKDTLAEAKMISNLTEKVYINDDEVKKYNDDHRIWREAVNDLWMEDLRQEYKDCGISTYVFDLCFEKACQAANSYGYDAVVEEMVGMVDFALDIIHNS